MKLGTGDIITLEGSVGGIVYYRITLDVNKQRVYWVKYNWLTNLYRVISSDYDGEEQKIIVTDQKLNEKILGVWDNSIFVMKNDKVRMLMINETDSTVFRKIAIERSDYLDVIVFNSKFNHTTGE